MGPLWGYVLLWLVSAYGIVSLLYRWLVRRSLETVPTTHLEAKPVAAEPPAQAELSSVIPSSDDQADAGDDSMLTYDDEHPDITRYAGPRPEDPFGPSALAAEDAELSVSLSGVRPDEDEIHVGSAPREEDDGLTLAVRQQEDAPEIEIVRKAISLESLTLGMSTDELMEEYGPPGHLSKVGTDGEQWRYPLDTQDEDGEPLEGVLVLEFQRGRLVRKAFEQDEKAGASKEAPREVVDAVVPPSGGDPSP